MYKLSSRWLTPLLVSLGYLVLGCGGGGGGGTPPPTTTIAQTSSNSGDGQTGTVAQPLAAPIRVVVIEDGTPASNTTVTWSTTVPGASLAASSATDADGIASNAWTLGTVSGTQTARAALSGASGSPVTFTATAAPGSATSLSKAGGDGQTAEINTPLGAPVQAKVSDQFGNGVPGVNVAWEATGGTPSAATVASDGSGISAVNVTLGGTIGDVTITAAVDGLTGTPLTFTAAAVAVGPIPTSASVRVGNILFSSNRNGTVNPAVDTVAVGSTVTWTWTNTAAVPHSVLSTGSPSFTSSDLKTGSGQSYAFTFPTAGTYQYTCAEHPAQMTGRIVVR